MKLSARAMQGVRPAALVLDERGGERLVYCAETVRYRLEARGTDGWALVAASGWLPDVLGLPPVAGVLARMVERFPAAMALPFAARDYQGPR